MAKAERKDPPRGFGPSAITQGLNTAVESERDRSWELKHRACTYKIPRRLHAEALQVRNDILSITQFNENGQERKDGTTVDDVASVLIDYALHMVERDGVAFAPTPQGRLSIHWELPDTREPKTVTLKPPVRNPQYKSGEYRSMALAYRWPQDMDASIKMLAGPGNSSSTKKSNPHKHAVPVGEVVVRLLQRAITAYQQGNLCLVSGPVQARQTVHSWQGSE